MHLGGRWSLASCAVITVACLASRVAAVEIEVRYVDALPGDVVVVDVVLHSYGVPVAGTQNDIAFGPEATILANANDTPDCSVNGAIDKDATVFGFLPFGCIGDECSVVRALVLALDNIAAIPDGAVLYSCRVSVAANAPTAEHPLLCFNADSSSPDGDPWQTSCRDGGVLQPGGTPVPTRTPAPERPRLAGTPCERSDECAFGKCFDGACCVAGCDADQRCVWGRECRPRCDTDLDCGPHADCFHGGCYEVSDDTSGGHPTGGTVTGGTMSDSGGGGCMVVQPATRAEWWLLGAVLFVGARLRRSPRRRIQGVRRVR